MDLSDHSIKYWLGVGGFYQFGSKRISALLSYFQNIESAYKASAQELIQAGISEKIGQEFLAYKEKINLDQLLASAHKNNIKILTINDAIYPSNLKQTENHPIILYYKGEIPDSNQHTAHVAVVGTRKVTPYGARVTREIVSHLIKNNIVIISGLALGVDTIAHQTTVDSNGKTIAILGNGLDNIYPPQNAKLAQDIIDTQGAIMSEYPLGAPALHYHFPYRNRIISGLSDITIVTEADADSGALITAKYAIQQGRSVYVVPGNIYSHMSSGCNKLINQGAKLITSPENILEIIGNPTQKFTNPRSIKHADTTTAKTIKKDLARHGAKTKIFHPDNPTETLILKYLTEEPVHIDELVRKTNLTTQEVNSTLSIIELKGGAQNIGGMNWIAT